MTSHTITLRQIRDAGLCDRGWRKLLAGLGTRNLKTRLTIGDVAAINDATDAFWCLRLLDDRRMIVRAVMPTVRRAMAHTTAAGPSDAVAFVERWLDGENIRRAKLRTADAAASAAAAAAASAAAAAAYAAAYAAAHPTAYAAAYNRAVATCTADGPYATERQRQVADLIALFGRLHAHEEVTS